MNVQQQRPLAHHSTCDSLSGLFGSSEESRLSKLTKLAKLVLRGSATGSLPDSKYTNALDDLTIDVYFDGPIPVF